MTHVDLFESRQRKSSKIKHLLTDKVVIVTGASSGIGAATAWELARHGARVVLAARRQDSLNAQVHALNDAGHTAVAFPTDVTDRVQVERLVAYTLNTFGRIDILINSAGIAWSKPFLENSPEEILSMLNVNLTGTMLMTHTVLLEMSKYGSGTVISVGSVAGRIAIEPIYSTTKFGLRGFSLALRRQLAKSGIEICIVSPGFISTAMTPQMHLRLQPKMPGPEVVAKSIVQLIVHPRPEVVVPSYYRVLVQGEHLFPWLADYLIRWVYRSVFPK